MVAEGEMVAIRFIRTGEMEGKPVKLDMMQFMHISDGVIVEIWEAYNPGQIESRSESSPSPERSAGF